MIGMDRETFQNRLKSLWKRSESGETTDASSDERDARQSLSINIGIDFGTTFTKVCYRNLNTEQSGIVDFSGAVNTDWNGALIPSNVVIGSEGQLLCGVPRPTEGEIESREINALKIRLAELDLEEELKEFDLEPLEDFGDESGIEFLATVFLANVLISSRNWLLINRSDMFRNREVVWSSSVGVPVKIYDSLAIDRFNRVLANAWRMAEGRDEVLDDLNEAKEYFEASVGSALESAVDVAVDVHAYPEIAAAVLAFVNSPSAQDGFYLYLDVGGGTLDSVSFRLSREDGRKQVDFFMGDIRPSGVDAIVSRHVDLDPKRLVETMREGRGEPTYEKILLQEQSAIQSQVGRVLRHTRTKNNVEWSPENVNPSYHQRLKSGGGPRENMTVPVFIGGGGSGFGFFESAIMGSHAAESLSALSIPDLVKSIVPMPTDLEFGSIPPTEFHRFAIAYGLSVDFGEAPQFELPREIPEMGRRPRRREVLAGHYED